LQGGECSDLTRGQVQGLAGPGTGELLSHVAANLQRGEIGEAAGVAEPPVRLHLRIDRDEITCHDLSGKRVRRGLDQEEDERHRQVAVRDAGETRRDELAVHHPLPVVGRQADVRQHVTGGRLGKGRARQRRHTHQHGQHDTPSTGHRTRGPRPISARHNRES
jgi:hypothetical protein